MKMLVVVIRLLLEIFLKLLIPQLLVPFLPGSQLLYYKGGFIKLRQGALSDFFRLREGATVHVNLDVNSSLQIAADRNGSNLGTSTETLTEDVWHYIQIKIVINDTTGSVKVIVDGTTFLDLTNQDTRNGGTGVYDTFDFKGNNDCQWNAFFVADSQGSDFNDLSTDTIDFTLIRPDGAGNSTQFTPSSGNNYQTVDETPVDETDYNESSTDTHKDTFTLESLGADALDVTAVIPFAVAEKTTSGSGSLNSVSRHSTSESAGSDIALEENALLWVSHVDHVNPSTSSTWTVSEVNAAEAGYEASI